MARLRTLFGTTVPHILRQMGALKKCRAKAQQTARVERVMVNKGGQTIVGDVTHKEEG